MRIIAVISLLLLTIAGCADSGTNPSGPPPAGVYRYIGYDSTGIGIVSGVLTINCRAQNYVDGGWSLERIGNAGNIGPQVGTGKLSGGKSGDMLWLDLQPQFRDNNVDIIGNVSGSEFRGRWHWITYSGVTNTGTFIAVRI